MKNKKLVILSCIGIGIIVVTVIVIILSRANVKTFLGYKEYVSDGYIDNDGIVYEEEIQNTEYSNEFDIVLAYLRSNNIDGVVTPYIKESLDYPVSFEEIYNQVNTVYTVGTPTGRWYMGVVNGEVEAVFEEYEY